MPVREVEVDGFRWTVFEVRPQGGAGVRIPKAMKEGWLAFHNGFEKRRVFPIPAGWYDWSRELLSSVIRGAKPVPR